MALTIEVRSFAELAWALPITVLTYEKSRTPFPDQDQSGGLPHHLPARTGCGKAGAGIYGAISRKDRLAFLGTDLWRGVPRLCKDVAGCRIATNVWAGIAPRFSFPESRRLTRWATGKPVSTIL